MTFPNDSEPVPMRLLRAVPGGALGPGMSNVVPLRRRKAGRWRWPQWLAIGASLIVGVSLGQLALLPAAYQRPIATTGGRMLASGALADALSHQLVSDQTAADPVSIGVSFRAKSGEYCRTFTSHQPALAGVACRTAAGWQLRVAAPPLDAQAEVAARGRHWRP